MKYTFVLFLVFASLYGNARVKDSLSYAIGLQMSTSLLQSNILNLIDENSLSQAISDLKKGTPSITMEEAQIIVTTFFINRAEIIKAENLKTGEEFLANNLKSAGVIQTESGLQYIILREGQGPKPTATSEVEVNYKGALLDGTVFDSSYKRGKSITFPLERVIAGWTEGLQYLAEGGQIRLFIPSHLAYGEGGHPPTITPNSTLIFEIELIKVIEPNSLPDQIHLQQ